MKLFEEMVARLRVLFFGSKAIPAAPAMATAPSGAAPPAVPAVAVIDAPDPVDAGTRSRNSKPAPAGGKAGSNALQRAQDLLTKNPDLTAAQIASSLGVSQSYARTLLRRAKINAPQPKLAPVPVPQPDLQATVRQLASRLEETESSLELLRTTPAAPPRPAAVPNRRAEVLRLSAEGQSPAAIAATLAIPTGEVEFIVKIDRMSAARV